MFRCVFRVGFSNWRVVGGSRVKDVGKVHAGSYVTVVKNFRGKQISSSSSNDHNVNPGTTSNGRSSAEHDGELFKPFTPEEDSTKFQKETFQFLFENSQFVEAVDPVGKEVEAEILAVVGDKLYVDFGCKFHAVILLPEKNTEQYTVGARVIVVVKDVEVTDHFIGNNRHQSLLEAEAELVRLVA